MSAITITAANFQKEVIESNQPVLLDFWAAWCGPCRMISPIVDEVAREQPGIKVGKVNVDEQPRLAELFQVMSIPTLVLVKDGRVTRQLVGVRPKRDILEMLA